MIQYLCFAGGAIFGFLIGGLMAAAHDDPFTSTAGETIEELLGDTGITIDHWEIKGDRDNE